MQWSCAARSDRTPGRGEYHARRVRASSTRALLFTDVEGSTALIQRLGDRFADVLERHQAIIRSGRRRSVGGGGEQ
jgi:class 3 adenylate cyclase